MKHTVRTFVLLCAVAALVLPSVAFAAEDGQVEFVNRTSETQHLLVVFGGDGKCEDKSQREQLMVDPGQSVSVEVGESMACWCHTSFGKIGDCGTWSKAKPGKMQKIR